jgi:hypothetical protein
MAYVVYHAPKLRAVVFSRLGIDRDAFQSAEEYAVWLGMKSRGSETMSNLIEVVCAVGELHDGDELPEATLDVRNISLSHKFFLTDTIHSRTSIALRIHVFLSSPLLCGGQIKLCMIQLIIR